MTAKKKSTEVDVMNEINRVPMTPSSREKMSLNIYDLQYLIRLQDLSNEAFKQTFDEEFRKDLVVSIAKELAEVLVPINDKLAELALGQKVISDNITEIKSRLDEMETKVESEDSRITVVEGRLEKKKKKLAELEAKVEMLQPDIITKCRQEMEELAPLLSRSIRLNSLWNIGLRIVSGIVLGFILVWLSLKYIWNLL